MTLRRCYPEDDYCDIYIEDGWNPAEYSMQTVFSCRPTKPEETQTVPKDTPIPVFQGVKTICAWGIGDTFRANTGTGTTFARTNLRYFPKNKRLPKHGKRELFAIHRTGPWGFQKTPLIESPLKKPEPDTLDAVSVKAPKGKGKKK